MPPTDPANDGSPPLLDQCDATGLVVRWGRNAGVGHWHLAQGCNRRGAAESKPLRGRTAPQTGVAARAADPAKPAQTGSSRTAQKEMHPRGVPKSDALLACRYPPAQVQRMKVLIHGRNLEITPALREYTNTKLERATSHFGDAIREADVHLSVARNPRVPQQTAEVTVFANGTVIRAQERSENLYASIDLVASKLARQLRRFKERHSDHGHRTTPTAENDVLLTERPTEDSLLEGKEAQLPSPGVRRKYFAMPAMSLEEARHQLEMIDHDFYLFRDKESGELQVIYHRNHGGFGVIQARN